MFPSIDDFVATEMAKPFRWRETDCCATADRRISQLSGRSPLALCGYVYSGELEARALLDRPGGLPIALNRAMRQSGFSRAAMVDVDAIGLVIFGTVVAVGIWTGSIWWSRDSGGFLGAPLEAALKAWRVR